MKTLLYAASAVALMLLPATARADAITFTATVDGVLVNTTNSANGSLSIVNQAFGIFNLNKVDVSSQTFTSPPDILDTNTMDVAQSATGQHTLVLDIIASGLVGPGALSGILSEFSVTGLTAGWSVFGQTYINGALQVTSPTVTGNSALGSATTLANLTNPFTAEVKYTLMTNGPGQFNGGIDIATAAVPGPVVGAGLPGIIAGAMFLLGLARRRRQAANV